MMAYLLKVDGTIEQMGWNPSLEELQAAVGGYIEMVRTNNVGYLYCNEEGKLLGLPVNMAATTMIEHDDVIRGDVVVMELDEEKEEEDEDMSEASIRHFQEKLWKDFLHWCDKSALALPNLASLEVWLNGTEEVVKTGMRAMWHEKNGGEEE